MGWKVIISPSAQADLEEIVRYAAQRNSDAALRLGYQLIIRAEAVAAFPPFLPATNRRRTGKTGQGEPGKGGAGPGIAGENHAVMEMDGRRMAGLRRLRRPHPSVIFPLKADRVSFDGW